MSNQPDAHFELPPAEQADVCPHPLWTIRLVSPYRCLQWFIAAILILAALLKAYQLATVPFLGEGLLQARWFNTLVVAFELFLGLWLIFGLLPKLTWLLTIGCFSVFVAVSLYKALSGEASCGCFGPLTVNPWITGAFDVIILFLLRWSRTEQIPLAYSVLENEWKTLSQCTKKYIVIVCGLYVALSAGAIIGLGDVGFSSNGSGLNHFTRFGKRIVHLSPQKWEGLYFPLLPYIVDSSKNVTINKDLPERLKTGEWTVLLYHYDCQDCQKALRRLTKDKMPNLACIEVPPCHGINSDDYFYGCLSDKETWFVATPSIITLNNGKVVGVYSNF